MFKIATVVVLLSLFLIFTLQNASPITVDFLIWELQSPRAVVLFLVFFAGLATGVLLTLYRQRSKQKEVTRPPIRYN